MKELRQTVQLLEEVLLRKQLAYDGHLVHREYDYGLWKLFV
jgi:hypothetical protein